LSKKYKVYSGGNILNQKTISLISYLRGDSREKLTAISKKTGIPISTLFDLLKELQDDVITRCTVLLDFHKLGFHTRSQLFLKIKSENQEKILNFLSNQNCINSIYKTNNGWNLIAETVHKNNKELDSFIEQLHEKCSIDDHKIHYLIDDIQKENFLINP